MPLRVSVALETSQDGQVGLPVYETGVMVRNEHRPLCAWQAPHALPHVAGRVHETFLARLTIRVRAGIGGIGEHVVDGGIGGDHPADLGERTPSHGGSRGPPSRTTAIRDVPSRTH